MEKRELKLYHGVIVLALCAVTVFWISPLFGRMLGIYGTVIGEVMILAEAVLLVLTAGGDMRKVFPLHRPKLAGLLGTMLMWGATFVSVMAVMVLIACFFPNEVAGASDGLDAAIISTPMLIATLIIAVSPAVCEEAVFRGVLLNSLRGVVKNWGIILIVGIIFGAFHGNIWKFIPTAALGMVMTYIVLETDNMVYSMLLHFINNLVPILMIGSLKGTYDAMGDAVMEMQGKSIPIAAAGVYFLLASGAPVIFYIGRHCLRKSTSGQYSGGLFMREQVKPVLILAGIGFLIAVVGICMIIISAADMQQGIYSGLMDGLLLIR